ncbi:MAG: hypothetical protein ABFS30_13885 [Pseudomonadota bacterium]
MKPRREPLMEQIGPWLLDGLAMIAGAAILVPVLIFAVAPMLG